MATFAHVLEATRANLGVMDRLRELRVNRIEYGERQKQGTPKTESVDGNN
jgi:hypothetical protein